jgi:hypothetical protein
MSISDWLGLGRRRDSADCARVPCFEQLEPRLLLSSDPVGGIAAPALANESLDTVITVDLTPAQAAPCAEQIENQDQPTVLTVVVGPEDSDREGTLGDARNELTGGPSDLPDAAQQTIIETANPPSATSFVSQEPQGEPLGSPEELSSATTEQLVETLRGPNGPPGGAPQGFAQVVEGVLVFRASAAQNDVTLRFGGTDTPVLDLLAGADGQIGSWRAADIRAVQIIGTDEANDTLSIDINPLQSVTCSIFYQGGAGGYDSLAVTSASRFSMDYEAVGTDAASRIFVSFSGLEPVDVQGVQAYTFTTTGGADNIVIDSPVAQRNRISGTSGGTSFESVTFWNVPTVTLDTGAHDVAGANADSILIDSAGLIASSLTAFTVTTGDGNDVVTVVPSAQVTIHVASGPGMDELIVDPQGRAVTFGDNAILVAGMQPVTYDAQTEIVTVQGLGSFWTGGIMADHPLAYYRLGESSGVVAADLSGYARRQ